MFEIKLKVKLNYIEKLMSRGHHSFIVRALLRAGVRARALGGLLRATALHFIRLTRSSELDRDADWPEDSGGFFFKPSRQGPV
jgi:hypothetical protein